MLGCQKNTLLMQYAALLSNRWSVAGCWADVTILGHLQPIVQPLQQCYQSGSVTIRWHLSCYSICGILAYLVWMETRNHDKLGNTSFICVALLLSNWLFMRKKKVSKNSVPMIDNSVSMHQIIWKSSRFYNIILEIEPVVVSLLISETKNEISFFVLGSSVS